MVTVWSNTEDGKGWKKIPGMEFSEADAHRVADHYNKKYRHRHYWVSHRRPGHRELQHVKDAKRNSKHGFVDCRAEKAGENHV